MQFKNLFSVAALLFLGAKVNAETDCEIFQSAVPYLNDQVKNAFKLDRCCYFNGIRCDKNQNIVELRFNNLKQTNNLKDFIDRIANLKNLQYLDLTNDNAKGQIPQSLCTITSLKNLNLAKNNLEGAIPYQCKDLQNLEQANFEGNANLTGYIPVLNNIKGCAYKNTGLCDVNESKCMDTGKFCTEDDIKNTNAINGNPNPVSNTYEGAAETRSRDMNVYYDNYNDYSYGYSGYNDYSYGNYDTNNYYGNDGYGYGYGDWSNNMGYDNSYYDSGYYGTGYDNSYTGTGYSTDYYTNGYTSGFSGSSITDSSYNNGESFFTSVVGIILYCIFFVFLIAACCACCICGSCCCGSKTEEPTVVANTGKPQSHTIKIDNEPNPYITNNGAPPYAGHQNGKPFATPQGGNTPYAAQQSNQPYGAQQNMYGRPGYGFNREVETEETDIAEIKKTEE